MVLGFVAGAAAGLFGGKKSKTETVNETTIVNESVFKALSESINTTSAEIITDQQFSVSGVDAYCTLNITQNTNIDVKVMQDFDEEQTQDLLNKIMSDLDKKARQAIEQKTGWFSTGSSKSENVDKTITSITNTAKKDITSRLINTLAGEVATTNGLKVENLKLDPYGIGIYEKLGTAPPPEVIEILIKAPPCIIDQDLQVRYVSEQLGSKIVDIINKDENAQKLVQDIDQESDQESQGAGEALADMFKGIGDGIGKAMGGAAIPSMISAFLLCVCCLALLAFGLSPAGQSAGKNMGSAAARRF